MTSFSIAQALVMVLVIVVLTVIPRQINRISELSRLQSAYMLSYSGNKKQGAARRGGHVIVTGVITYESVAEFLAEFYRKRLGRVHMDVVVLADETPCQRLEMLLARPAYRRRVMYLKGTLLNEKDAERAQILDAAAVFILANSKVTHGSDDLDALTVLQTLSIEKYRFRRRLIQAGRLRESPRKIRCFVQVMSPVRSRGLRSVTGVEVVLNTPRLRTSILARSVVCPGSIALLLNLIYSAPQEDVEAAKQQQAPWIKEYAHGLQHQIFPVYLTENFAGVKYEKAAAQIYERFRILLIATYCEIEDGHSRVALCPFGLELKKYALGFFVAPSASVAKHAVDTFRVNDLQSNPAKPPELVFSSDSVLDRQSFIRGRFETIPFCEDDDDSDDSDEAKVNVLSPVPNAGASSPSLSRSVSVDSMLTTSKRKHLRGHILICGPFQQAIQVAWYLDDQYAREQPTKSSESQTFARPAVVLLVKSLPGNHDLTELQRPIPPNTFLEKGDSQMVEDLMRVRAFDAHSVVFVPGSWKYRQDEVSEDQLHGQLENLLDYHVIMSTLSLRSVQEIRQRQQHADNLHKRLSIQPCTRKTTNVMAVLRSHDGVTYFSHKDIPSPSSKMHLPTRFSKRRCEFQVGNEPDALPPSFVPSYAAGQVFVDGVLDTLLCQSFFNPYVLDLMRDLVGDGQSRPQYPKSAALDPLLTASNLTEDVDQGKLAQTAQYSANADLLDHPVLALASVDINLEGSTFIEVFHVAIQQGMLAIGIYRGPDPIAKGNTMPYVYTCPDTDKHTYLSAGDQVYVITRKRLPLLLR